MKKIFIILGLLLTTTAFSAESENKSESFREQWMCTGYGTLNIGGPAGSITMTVHGYGETQLEAMTDAQQRCWSQGLQMCMVNNCFKR